MTCESEEPEYGLVMTFVNVTSQGGRYDDDAYCAGWEMGHLDAVLAGLAERYRYDGPPDVEVTIRTDNAEQADLVAMQYGYRAEVTNSGVDGWSHLTVTKARDS